MSIACNGPVNDDCRPSAADAIVGRSTGTLRAALGTLGAVVVTPSGNRLTHSWLPTVAVGLSGSEMTDKAASTRQRLVVIGNGMAAGRVLDELFARAPDRYDVTMFGAEPRVNYDRIMLSPVLAGEKQFHDIIVHNEDWYARHHVDLRRG